MPLSNNLSQYTDVRAILDEALRLGGLLYELPAHGKAMHWRHRANKFRTLIGDSAYDTLIFTVRAGEPTVEITPRKIEGNIKTLSGTAPASVDEEDLLAEAEALAKELDNGS